MIWLMPMPVETFISQRSSLCPYRSFIGDTGIKIYSSSLSIANCNLAMFIEHIPIVKCEFSRIFCYLFMLYFICAFLKSPPGTTMFGPFYQFLMQNVSWPSRFCLLAPKKQAFLCSWVQSLKMAYLP